MKKKQILNSATELFMQFGFGNVSMDQVARVANVSKATLYAHFNSKNELFISVLEYYKGQHQIKVPNLPDVIPSNLTIMNNDILNYLSDIFNYFSNDDVVQLYRLLISEIKQFPDLFDLFFVNQSGEITQKLASYLSKYANKVGCQSNDEYMLACNILDLVRGVTIWAKLVQNPSKQIFVEEEPSKVLKQLHHRAMLMVNNYYERVRYA